jgi:copper chaperone CopZ
MTTYLRLLNSIDSCEKNSLINEIEDFDGVYNAEINLSRKEITVEFNEDVTTEDEIKEVIEGSGYDIKIK